MDTPKQPIVRGQDRFRFSSLRARLLLLVLLAVIPALGLVSYTAIEQRRHATVHLQEHLLQLSHLAAAEERRLVEGARQLLVALAQLPAVRQRDPAACSAFLRHLLGQYPLYANLGAIKPNGDLFCSALPLSGPIHLADRPYFRRAVDTRDFSVGDYQIGRVTGKATLNFGYPALDETGGVRAVVFAALDLGWLNQLAAGVRLPEGAVLVVIDRTGTILARYPDPEQWVGKSAPDHPVLKAIQAGGAGVTEAPGSDGIPRFFAFGPLLGGLEAGHVYISIDVPKVTVLSEVNRALARNLAGLLLAAVAALAAAWVIGDLFILRRVNALVAATKRLAAGDLSARTGLAHDASDLGELTGAFDAMAAGLEQATQRNQLLLNSAGEGIYGVDLGGTITFVNPAAAQMVGWDAEELIGKPGHATMHHSKPDGTPYPSEQCPIYAAFTDGVVHRVHDEVFWRKDGTSFPVEYVSTPVREQDRLVGAVVVFKDVSERKQMEASLRQSEKLAAMGSLLAGVAHELNNPLGVVLGQASLLSHAVGGGPLAERAEQIAKAARRCARIVQNFLALARQRPLERQQIKLNQVIEEAVELVAYPLRVNNVEVQLNLQPDLPPIWADPHQLHQVVVNLLTNAEQAMRETAPPRRITLTTGHDPARRRVRLEVTDTGSGIPPEIRARIFEPFFTTKPAGQGTGLGLSICHGIISSHGGTIGVESRPGQGAVFVIELPVEVAPEAVPHAPALETLPPIRGKAILVVDDEPDMSRTVAEMLTLEGHQVETAANGSHARVKLEQRAYDLILSDLKMPELDGPGLYREVARRWPALCRRFIFLTGDTLSAESQRFLEQTRAPSLTKPFELAEVRQVVQQVLREA